jgi:hypothetical protein
LLHRDPVDIDAQAGETTALIAQAAVTAAGAGRSASDREQRSPSYLAWSAAFAGAATLLYGALLWLIFGDQQLGRTAPVRERGKHFAKAASRRRATRSTPGRSSCSRGARSASWPGAGARILEAHGWVLFSRGFRTRAHGASSSKTACSVWCMRLLLAIVGALPGICSPS